MLNYVIQRGVILSVIIAIICLFGLVSIFRVPVQMTPDIERPIISVRTQWPGANPQDIETEILIEQENYLRSLQGLQQMVGEAKTGQATIDLEFSVETDIQEALIRVNNALTQVANYPENVDPPQLLTSSSSQDSFIFYNLIALNPEVYQPNPAELTHILDKHILTRLERVPGVSDARIFGEVERQVQLAIDPAELAARGITVAELRDAIRNRNRDMSGGDIDSGKRRFTIRTIGRFTSLEDIGDTIIREQNGHVVKIRDIGEITLASHELRARAYFNGKPGFTFGIIRTPGANVIDIFDQVNAEVENLNNTTLKQMGLRIVHYADDVQYVKDAISVVQKNLILGGLLACLILYLFLHAAAPTLLGALGVPLCAIGAFLGLLLADRTLNVISLAGVAFAIGMTLDNSIVVLENIFRHRSLGKSRFQAAIDGVNEVWTAVLASTLTTIFVFAPIVLIDDEIGQLYSDIAIAISAAIVMSMLVAITAIPAVAARLPENATQQNRTPSPLLNTINTIGARFRENTVKLLEKILASRKKQIATVAGTLSVAACIFLLLLPSAEYLPEGEESKIFAIVKAPPGYNIDEVDNTTRSLESLILPQIGADGSAYQNGDTPVPPMRYLLRVASGGQLFSISEPISREPGAADDLRQAITDHLGAKPGMIAFAARGSIFSDNRGGSRGIQLDIVGPNLNSIYETALTTYLKSKELFSTAQIRPEPGLSLSQPNIEIRPNWQRANEVGMNANDLGYLVWALSDGAYLDDFFLDDEKIDIYLYSKAGKVTDKNAIRELPIYTPQGKVLPLGALVDIAETVTAETIRRVDGRRTVTINIVPPKDIPLEQAVSMVEKEIITPLNTEMTANNVQILLGGASDKLASAQQALSGNFLIAIALSYLLMVAIFSHWGYPLLILMTIPLGISGGILGLWVMNNVLAINVALDMITMLGMVVLLGTVVNNPILLVEQTRRLLLEGLDVSQAILQSVEIRLRPIMMSMLTTVFGLSPVVFLSGAGTDLYRGLGTIVLFGLLFSTLLTLTFLPACLALIFGTIQKRR